MRGDSLLIHCPLLSPLSYPLQVPQFLLEDAVQRGQGGATSIIVCQPRRIAAVGLATRVAAETGDPAGLGGLVGYSVRLDSRCSSSTRLLFCTTGVLLRRLADDPDLQGASCHTDTNAAPCVMLCE